LRDTPRCVDALEKAIEIGLFDVAWLERCPLFDPLRGTLRFEAVRRTAHDRAMEVLGALDRCLAEREAPSQGR
jgi:hypothetical protein